MSLSHNNTKRNIFVYTLILIGVLILWFLFSWIQNFRGATVPIYSDASSLVFNSKQSLIKKVLTLQSTLDSQNASLVKLSALESENEALKAEFGREGHVKGILARVIVPPNRSLYDTVILDAGNDEGIHINQKVYAFGSIALGNITQVSKHSSTVTLFSASGRETAGTTSGSDMAVTLIGRGAGEYEVRMPRDVIFEQGGIISEQTLGVHPLATIQKIITDPRDPFQRLLAKAPVNLQTMKWVVVK